ncbi:MAG: hypothetical protein ACE5I5_05940 [Candidatus Heimdallarchaeota archaeon]
MSRMEEKEIRSEFNKYQDMKMWEGIFQDPTILETGQHWYDEILDDIKGVDPELPEIFQSRYQKVANIFDKEIDVRKPLDLINVLLQILNDPEKLHTFPIFSQIQDAYTLVPLIEEKMDLDIVGLPRTMDIATCRENYWNNAILGGIYAKAKNCSFSFGKTSQRHTNIR